MWTAHRVKKENSCITASEGGVQGIGNGGGDGGERVEGWKCGRVEGWVVAMSFKV